MRILMPVDGSPYSDAAVAFVASRATLLAKPTVVELIHVQHPVPPRAARAAGRDLIRSWHEAEAAKVLTPAVTTLRGAGADARPRHVVGTVAEDLARIVADDPADLIVMGSHGHTGLKKVLLGSVASVVAASCTKPLLLFRGGPAPTRDSMKVGIALDGSPYGLATARFLVRHRDLFGASPRVTLIHVVPDLAKITVPGWVEREVPTGIRPDQIEAIHKAAFENVFQPARTLLERAGIQASEVRLVGQSPGDAIAAHATTSRPDLLAMGSLGFGASRHAGLGSVATRVASRCRTALLLVREK